VTAGERPLEVIFVCWGNICRSPIAERVAEHHAGQAGLQGVRFSSAATSTEELGDPMDPRATAVLREHGYRDGDHVAHQISAEEIDSADLVVAMEPLHIDRMGRLGDVDAAVAEGRMALLTDYDPQALPGSGVPDPWYGGPAGFEDTLAAVEAAMPGLLESLVRLRQEASTGPTV